MRVLVTGGAGFIGSHVVEGALAAGFEVAVLDNFATGKRENLPSSVRTFEVDLRDRQATFHAVADFAPELVSHHAAQTSVPVSMKDPHFDAQVNVMGGLNLLDACTAAGSRTRHFVFASTGGASYGEVPEGERASEGYPLEPKSPYGINKLTFERLLAVYRAERGLSTNVLRYSNVYGPRQDRRGEAGVVALFFDAALAEKSLTVFAKRTPGDGGGIRDYVFVADVVRANLHALDGRLAQPVLNVGSGRATSTLDLAGRIVELCGSRSRVQHAEARPGDVERSLLDVSSFEQLLGAPTPLEAGLAQTARWYRER
jgi:UDP-glucose 4-epimerase